MNLKFLIFFIIYNLFSMALLSSASCLRGTRHMWQLQPPTELVSCNRPSTLRSKFDENEAVAVADLDNDLTLGPIVYQCAANKRNEIQYDSGKINYPDKMNETAQTHGMSM